MLELNDLIHKAGIDPAEVLVMRHRPQEPELRRVFAWIATERPELFKAYQASQFPRAEKALAKARYIVSLIGFKPTRALFINIYEVCGQETVTRGTFLDIPENIQLTELGMTGWSAKSGQQDAIWFDLQKLDSLSDLSGRLEIEWVGGERSWFRWAQRNRFPIKAIHEASILERDMPEWDALVLSWNELDVLPASWAARLAEWRGIYLIVDQSDGRGYVGAAYGSENILGRWRTYARTGHGENRELKGCDPRNFLFSILQRVSPDMDPESVVRLEATWKTRLHTRRFGLNQN